MRLILLLIGVCFLIFSCESDSDGYVARYGDYVLTKTDVIRMLPTDLDKEDSLAYVNQIIEQWAKDKVLLNNSKNILSEEELSQIELKVAHYEDDITTSFLEDKLTQDLNDSISGAEITAYYNQYRDSFELKEDYLNYRYMIIPKDSASIYKTMLRKSEYGALKQKLDVNGYQNDLNTQNWISKQKFNKTNLFPKELKQQNLRTKNQIFTVQQNTSIFVFELVEYRKAGQTSPLPLVKDMIKNVLINKRKLNLLSEKKKELYNKALRNDEIKKN